MTTEPLGLARISSFWQTADCLDAIKHSSVINIHLTLILMKPDSRLQDMMVVYFLRLLFNTECKKKWVKPKHLEDDEGSLPVCKDQAD